MDIIFSAAQTAELLKKGYVTSNGGHGRVARADGTAYNMINAYATPKNRGSFNIKSSSSDSTSANTAATNANTSAKNSNTSATNKSTKSTTSLTDAIDWVQRRLDYFSDKTKAIADTITDYVTSAFKTKQLKKQISSVENEIAANQKAYETYMAKANSIGLSSSWVKKVQTGAYKLEDVTDDKTKEKIEAYEKYYDAAMDCKQAVTDLKNEQLELFEQWANMPTEAAEKKIDKLERKLKTLSSAYSTVSGGASTATQYINQIESDYSSALSTARSKYESATQKRSQTAQTHQVAKDEYYEAVDETKDAASALKKAASKKKNKVSSKTKKAINNAIKNGTKVSLSGLKGAVKTAAQKYNAAIDAQSSAKTTYQNAYNAHASAITEQKTAKQSYETVKSSLSDGQKIASQYKNDTTYEAQNALLDAQLEVSKQESEAYQQALKDATTNLAETKKANDDAQAAYSSALADNNSAKSALSSKQSSIKKNKSVWSKLTSSQKSAINSGKTVSTKGVKNKTVLKQLNAYNKLVASATSASSKLTSAQSAATQSAQEYTIAVEAQEEAQTNAAEAQAEYAQMIVDNEKEKFENIQSYYEAELSYQEQLNDLEEKSIELRKEHGDYTTTSDYQTQINNIAEERALVQKEITALQNQLNSSVSSGIILSGSEEWLEMQTTIVELQGDIADLDIETEKLNQSLLETKYAEMFDRAIDSADRLISKLETINGIITDEMKYDSDTGELTQMGMLSLALNVKDMNTNLSNLQTYVKKRQQIIDDYNSGKFGAEEYNELMESNESSIQSYLKSVNSARNEILSVIKTQASKEKEAIEEVIDARKKALEAKRDYYEYDQSLKSKNKEINALRQQVAALDGVCLMLLLFNC